MRLYQNCPRPLVAATVDDGKNAARSGSRPYKQMVGNEYIGRKSASRRILTVGATPTRRGYTCRELAVRVAERGAVTRYKREATLRGNKWGWTPWVWRGPPRGELRDDFWD